MYASKFAQETWGVMKDGEKAMMDEVEQRRQKAEVSLFLFPYGQFE